MIFMNLFNLHFILPNPNVIPEVKLDPIPVRNFLFSCWDISLAEIFLVFHHSYRLMLSYAFPFYIYFAWSWQLFLDFSAPIPEKWKKVKGEKILWVEKLEVGSIRFVSRVPDPLFPRGLRRSIPFCFRACFLDNLKYL